jgi:flagellar basal body-associated protein FliL
VTILGALVLLLMVFGCAIAYFGGAGKADPRSRSETAAPPPGPVVQLEPFTVSLLSDGGSTLLRVKLWLELEDWKVMGAVRHHLAPVQFTASSILAGQTYAGIRTPEGKQLLRARLHESINKALPDGGVKAVYFRELLYP